MKFALVLALLLAGALVFVEPAPAGDHRLGVGAHYWDTVDDIDTHYFEESGYSWVVSYQYQPTLAGIEIDLEFFDEKPGAADEWILSPQAYLLAGKSLYGGVGIGMHYAGGEASDPFYALKAGLVLELLPGILLDVNANYRFQDWNMDEVEEDVDADTVTLGALVRFEF